MKKIKSSFLAGLFALLLTCSCGGKGDLKEIAKPYLGVYKCTDARVGEREYLDRFSKLDLELKENGEFIVYYCEKGGKPQTRTAIDTGGNFKRDMLRSGDVPSSTALLARLLDDRTFAAASGASLANLEKSAAADNDTASAASFAGYAL